MMGAVDGDEDARYYEFPRHKVVFDEPFWVGAYEVSVREYNKCIAAGGCASPELVRAHEGPCIVSCSVS